MNAINAHYSESIMSARQRAPDFRMLKAMPLCDSVVLGAIETEPGRARRRAVAVLAEWGIGDLEYAVGMIISELATNAIRATDEVCRAADRASVAHLASVADKAPIVVWMRGARSGVYVLVQDAVPRAPEPCAPGELDELDESGRGLAMIVPAFSADWGWYEVPGGKVTWAFVDNASAIS